MSYDISKVKLNDIFRWSYTKERIDKMPYKTDIYWAVSRFCVAKDLSDGSLYLEDTFSCGDNIKWYLNEERITDIELEYLGNFDELEKLTNEYNLPYYDPAEILNLTHGNSSRGNVYIKKGAQRSLKFMKINLEQKIHDLTSKVAWAQRDLELARENFNNLTEETKDKIWI